MLRSPSPEALEAFGVTDHPTPLPGGRGQAWRAGAAVFKPSDAHPDEAEWTAKLLESLDGRPDFRIARPLRTVDGAVQADGWTASRWGPGRHLVGSWSDIVATGERLHHALRDWPAPPQLAQREDPWARADRVAWGAYAGFRAESTLLRMALDAIRPVGGVAQLVHADLTGNVLFSTGLPPMIIDFSLYWRPTHYAAAIVVLDALVFEDAPVDLVDVLDPVTVGQYLLRALIFRAATDQIVGVDPSKIDRTYAAAFEVAYALG